MDDSSFISYDIFRPYKNLLAFTTIKQTLNHFAPRFTGNDTMGFKQNRKKLATVLGIYEDQLVFPGQTHTNCVVELSGIPDHELQETDALVTQTPGICLCVQTADCVPILLFDPVTNAIGAVHAGWRGTVKLITAAAVEKLKDNFKSSPQNMLALIGPSVSPEIYEVGDEVIQAAQKNVPNPHAAIIAQKNGKSHFNLWEANRQVLLQSGLHSKNIQVFGECSFNNEADYFSARRDGFNTGRNVSGIMLH